MNIKDQKKTLLDDKQKEKVEDISNRIDEFIIELTSLSVQFENIYFQIDCFKSIDFLIQADALLKLYIDKDEKLREKILKSLNQ